MGLKKHGCKAWRDKSNLRKDNLRNSSGKHISTEAFPPPRSTTTNRRLRPVGRSLKQLMFVSRGGLDWQKIGHRLKYDRFWPTFSNFQPTWHNCTNFSQIGLSQPFLGAAGLFFFTPFLSLFAFCFMVAISESYKKRLSEHANAKKAKLNHPTLATLIELTSHPKYHI